jgi:flavodoxin
MKAVVVYDSFFGNTEKIAQAIAEALGAPEAVRVTKMSPDQLSGVELLVVGSPTRAFRPSQETKKLLGSIPSGSLKGVKVAGFDTGFAIEDTNNPILRFLVRMFGYAAKPISDALAKKGGEVALPPEGFWVTGTEGPLKEGELERAADWAKRILAAV